MTNLLYTLNIRRVDLFLNHFNYIQLHIFPIYQSNESFQDDNDDDYDDNDDDQSFKETKENNQDGHSDNHNIKNNDRSGEESEVDLIFSDELIGIICHVMNSKEIQSLIEMNTTVNNLINKLYKSSLQFYNQELANFLKKIILQ
ncbi:hypothetical protein ACTFIV_007692 [Dictyostelium citrinum]